MTNHEIDRFYIIGFLTFCTILCIFVAVIAAIDSCFISMTILIVGAISFSFLSYLFYLDIRENS